MTSTVRAHAPLAVSVVAAGLATLSFASGMLTPVGLITGLIALHLVGLAFAMHQLNASGSQKL